MSFAYSFKLNAHSLELECVHIYKKNSKYCWTFIYLRLELWYYIPSIFTRKDLGYLGSVLALNLTPLFIVIPYIYINCSKDTP